MSVVASSNICDTQKDTLLFLHTSYERWLVVLYNMRDRAKVLLSRPVPVIVDFETSRFFFLSPDAYAFLDFCQVFVES